MLIATNLLGNVIRPSSASGYNRQVIAELRRLEQSDRERHIEILLAHEDLIGRPINTTELLPHEEENLFTAANPEITWSENTSQIICDAVRYANNTSQYLFRRFKVLRLEALEYIDKMADLEGNNLEEVTQKYDAILAEISELLNLVEGAYPPAFYEHNIIATYTFIESNSFKNKILSNQLPYGQINVAKIKLGNNNWIQVPSGIKDVANFYYEPQVMEFNNSVQLTRQLSSMEACLGDLSVSFVGSANFRTRNTCTLITPIIICPTPYPRYTIPGVNPSVGYRGLLINANLPRETLIPPL